MVDTNLERETANEPVRWIATDDRERRPEPGMALCLSGGGYRAMLFHLGALWRLYETRLLESIKRISSVSGGSITAGVLGRNWHRLSFEPGPVAYDFVPHVVEPIRSLAGETIDADAIFWGVALPGRVSDRVAAAYDRYLFAGATLQDLPDEPRFVINATNVQSGVLWRFSKPYMWDYRVGKVEKPTVSLAQAVAASSAFPPVCPRLSCGLIRMPSPRNWARPAERAIHKPCNPDRRRRLRQSWALRQPGSAMRRSW
jgi:NTE family protein